MWGLKQDNQYLIFNINYFLKIILGIFAVIEHYKNTDVDIDRTYGDGEGLVRKIPICWYNITDYWLLFIATCETCLYKYWYHNIILLSRIQAPSHGQCTAAFSHNHFIHLQCGPHGLWRLLYSSLSYSKVYAQKVISEL